MKFITSSLKYCASVLVFAVSAPWAQASVVNGGFETTTSAGDPANWSITVPTAPAFSPISISTSFVKAGTNSVVFSVTPDSERSGSISQSVSLLPSNDYFLRFFVRDNLDALTFTFGTLTETDLTKDLNPDSDGWYRWSAELENFSGGDMVFAFNITGTDRTYIDAVSISDDGCMRNCPPPGNNVPEPGSLLLVGIALAGFAAVRRRSAC